MPSLYVSESVPSVCLRIIVSAECPAPPLLRAATSIDSDCSPSILVNPTFTAAVASGGAPRLQSFTCRACDALLIPRSLGQQLRELNLKRLGGSTSLTPELVSALAAAAPGLCVLEAPEMTATPHMLEQLHAALPGLEQCNCREYEFYDG